MVTIAVQFLENTPDVATITPGEARSKLVAAFARLPISSVIVGWNLPEPLVQACREATTRAGAQFFYWHPLLTGDGVFIPQPEWQTIGLQGEPVPGFRGLPEFTFICPNRPAVREATLDHLQQLIQHGDYEGIFLDRMRYPSPVADPARWLACFCDDCQRAAAEEGFDLMLVRRHLKQLLATPQRMSAFVHTLFGASPVEAYDSDLVILSAFLDFRARRVTKFIQAAAELIQAAGLTVALDCFSPSLTRMVGQDLGTLDVCGEWTKVMTYGHTFGPAGLPFELLELANWLVEKWQVSEAQALAWLAEATGLTLPASRAALRTHGLPPSALQTEMEQARAAGVTQLFAGVELVEIEGVAHHEPAQIEADLRALQQTDVDGLVLSWDLWHIPLERLELISTIWRGDL